MSEIARNISLTLKEHGIIHEHEVETCKYGLETFASTFIEIFSILIISLIMGNFIETLLLFVAFVPLRIFAGGYHADTRIRCFLVSLLVYALFYITVRLFSENVYLFVALGYMFFSLVSVLIFAPVVHKNKNVNEAERKYYRRFSIIIAISEIALVICLAMIFSNKVYSFSLASGQFAVAASMIMAHLKDRITVNK